MKNMILTIGVMMAMTFAASAQEVTEPDIVTDENVQLEMITPAEPVKESKQEIKEREKKLREFNDEVAFAKAANSIRRGYFVLVADYIQVGRTGYRHYDINPNSNFILVQAEDGIIQFAFNTGNPGSNGLGGWTAKGTVRNKKVTYQDNGDVHMTYQLVGSRVNVTVSVTLYHNTKRALARIMDGGDITFYGEILPYRDNKHR